MKLISKLEFYYYSGRVGEWWSDKTKLILISTQVELVVEVRMASRANNGDFQVSPNTPCGYSKLVPEDA